MGSMHRFDVTPVIDWFTEEMARRMPILIEFPVGNELNSVGSLRDTYGY